MKRKTFSLLISFIMIVAAGLALFFTFGVPREGEFAEYEIGEPVRLDVEQDTHPQSAFDGENVYIANRDLSGTVIVKRYDYRNMSEALDTIQINNPQGAFAGANINRSFGSPLIEINKELREIYICWTERNTNGQWGIFFNSLRLDRGTGLLRKTLANDALLHFTHENIFDIKMIHIGPSIYVFWATKITRTPTRFEFTVHISSSLDSGNTWSREPIHVVSFERSVNLTHIYETACQGANVYVAIQLEQYVVLAVSNDNGRNWRNDSIPRYHISPESAVFFSRAESPFYLYSGWGCVYVVYDLAIRSGVKRPYIVVSRDDGRSWNSRVELDDRGWDCHGMEMSDSIRDHIYILLTDNNGVLYIKQSSDNGITWSELIKVSSGESRRYRYSGCDMSLSNGILYVVWEDARRGIFEVPWERPPNAPAYTIGDIYCVFKKDNWKSFSNEIRLDEGADIGEDNFAMASWPIVISSGDTAYVKWQSCFSQEITERGSLYYDYANYLKPNTDAARIEGKVSDSEDNTPVSEALISFGEEYNVTTDENGRYAISLPAGTYTIRAEKDGHEPNESEHEIQPGGYLEHNISLEEINVAPQFPESSVKVDKYEGETTTMGPYDALDTNEDVLTYSVTGLPGFITYDSASRRFTCSPGYEDAGTYPPINITATEEGEGGLSGAMQIVVNVLNTNRHPELGAIQNQTKNEGETVQLNLTASDLDREDTVRFAMVNAPQGAVLDANTGAFSWTTNYNSAGTYSVTFYAYDGDSILQRGNDYQTITITVNNVSQPPVLDTIGNKTIDELQLLSIILNATDPDGNPLTYSAGNLPHGAKFNSATRTFTWTPNYDQAGTYPVTFTVNDGTGGSDSETITITVNNANQAPELAAIGNKTVNEGQPFSFTLSASDRDGNPLTYSASNLPQGASFNSSTKTFAWTPGYNQAGTYPVTFTVNDGAGGSDSETITITVKNVNQAPVIEPINAKEIRVRETLEFRITAADPDGDTMTYSLVNPPQSTFIDNQSGLFVWTPNENQTGDYVLTGRVSDRQTSTDLTFNVRVLPPAVVEPPPVSVTETIINFDEYYYKDKEKEDATPVLPDLFCPMGGATSLYAPGIYDKTGFWWRGYDIRGEAHAHAVVGPAPVQGNPNNRALKILTPSVEGNSETEFVFEELLTVREISFEMKFNSDRARRMAFHLKPNKDWYDQPLSAPLISISITRNPSIQGNALTIKQQGGNEANVNLPEGFFNFKITNINYDNQTCDIYCNEVLALGQARLSGGTNTTRRITFETSAEGTGDGITVDNINIKYESTRQILPGTPPGLEYTGQITFNFMDEYNPEQPRRSPDWWMNNIYSYLRVDIIYASLHDAEFTSMGLIDYNNPPSNKALNLCTWKPPSYDGRHFYACAEHQFRELLLVDTPFSFSHFKEFFYFEFKPRDIYIEFEFKRLFAHDTSLFYFYLDELCIRPVHGPIRRSIGASITRLNNRPGNVYRIKAIPTQDSPVDGEWTFSSPVTSIRLGNIDYDRHTFNLFVNGYKLNLIPIEYPSRISINEFWTFTQDAIFTTQWEGVLIKKVIIRYDKRWPGVPRGQAVARETQQTPWSQGQVGTEPVRTGGTGVGTGGGTGGGTGQTPGAENARIRARGRVEKIDIVGDRYVYRPIPGATVVFTHLETGETITVESNENGQILAGLPRSGKWNAYASKPGWTQRQIEITAPEEGECQCLFVLEELQFNNGVKGNILTKDNTGVRVARVKIVNPASEPEWLETTDSAPTNETGFYHIQVPAAGIYGISVSADGFKRWYGEVKVEEGKFTLYNVVLEQIEGAPPLLTSASGEIRFPQRCPVERTPGVRPDVLISFINKETGDTYYSNRPVFSVSQNSYSYAVGVPPGEYLVVVTAAKKYGLSDKTFETFIRERGNTSLNIFMETTRRNTGIIGFIYEIGSQDRKISNARVTATRKTDGSVYNAGPGAGFPGNYIIYLLPGIYTVQVSADGYHGFQKDVEIRPVEGDELGHIMYNIGLVRQGEENIPIAVLSGKVHQEGDINRKIEAAQIVFTNSANNTRYNTVSLPTAGNYNYSLSVPPGRYNVSVSARNYVSKQSEVTVPNEGVIPLNIALARAQVLQGTGAEGVVYKEGRAVTIAGATVRFTNSRTGLIKTVTTDSIGGYFVEIPAGKYNILVKALGYADKEVKDVNIVEGRITKIDIEMQWIGIPLRDAEISGIVCGGGGNLLGIEGSQLLFTYELDGSQYSTVSIKNGVFKTYVPEGNYDIAYSAPGYKIKEKIKVKAPRSELLIHLEREAEPAGRGIFGVGYEEGGYTSILNAVMQLTNTETDTAVDVNSNENGEFSAGELSTGIYRITTTADGYEEKEDFCYVNPEGLTRQNIVMKPVVQREGPGARGIVTEEQSGSPIGNVSIRFTSKRWGTEFTARTNQDGSYEIGFERPGKYRVIAAKSGYNNFEIKEINIGPEGYTVINIVLKRRR